MSRTSELSKYVCRIRNANKATYARAYVAWYLRGGMDEDTPEPEWGALSYMAAQSVRMCVQDIINAEANTETNGGNNG